MIEKTKKQGPVLLVDSGNALWKQPGLLGDADEKRAAFILATMGKLGTQAMAAGQRDLVQGPQWLKAQAAKAKVPVVSANIVGKDDKPFFAPSHVVETGGARVALIGASPAGPVPKSADVKAVPAAPLVRAEAKRLRALTGKEKVDLIVVLAAVPYADGLQLSRELGGSVDLILQSHEARGPGMAQKGDSNFVVPSGERGRMLGVLTVPLGEGLLQDGAELERDEQTLKMLEQQTETVKARIAAAKDAETKAALGRTLTQFDERKKDVQSRITAGRKAGGRRLGLEWVTLTPDVGEDAALAAEVRRIEPPGSAGH